MEYLIRKSVACGTQFIYRKQGRWGAGSVDALAFASRSDAESELRMSLARHGLKLDSSYDIIERATQPPGRDERSSDYVGRVVEGTR